MKYPGESPICEKNHIQNAGVRLLGFYDPGWAAHNPRAGEDKQKSSIAFVGTGVRWTVQKTFSWRFDCAQVVDQGAARARGARKA